MITEKNTGIVTDFKRFAVHDGDGIRTTVFLKGCPLKCIWCHNPESISPKPQLSFYSEKCTFCGECAKVCPMGAHKVENGVHTLDREKCTACGKCAEVCFASALKREGNELTVAEVIRTVAEDKLFYETSGGGMTISGGEPTMQAGFTLALLKAAKAEKINTALDTCGFAPREVYAELLPYVDTFLYDVKHIDPEAHQKLTGQRNERIIENLRFLSDSGARIEIRTPLIPGCNNDDETVRGIGKLLSEVKLTRMKLLPYHSYARSKYDALSIENTLPEVDRPDKAHLLHCAEIIRSFGINVVTE